MANNSGSQHDLVLADGGQEQKRQLSSPGHTSAGDNYGTDTKATVAAANGKQQHIDLIGTRQQQQQPPQRPMLSGNIKSGQRQQVVRCPCGRMVTTSPTNTMSSLATNQSDQSNKIEQMSKLTKWLCAIILALVLVVLVLIIIDSPYKWTTIVNSPNNELQQRQIINGNENFNNNNPTMQLNGTLASAAAAAAAANNQIMRTNNRLLLTERTADSSTRGLQQPKQQQVAQGKLLASSSDEHFTTITHSSDGLASGDNHDLDDQFDQNNNHQDNLPTSNDSDDDDDSNHDGEHRQSGNNNNNRRGNNNRKEVDRFENQISHRARGQDKVHRDPAPENVCMTAGCVRGAAQVLNNMDSSVKPCDDFYQFACSRWISSQVIPDEKTSLSVFSQNTADLNVKLRALIERPTRVDDPPIVGQMRNMYASCMNLSDIEARGDEPLLEVLRFFGGWPVLTAKTNELRSTINVLNSENNNTESTSSGQRRRRTNQNQSRRSTRETTSAATTQSNEQQQQQQNTSWLDILIKFRQRGFSHDMIIDLSVVPDVRQNKRYIIELDQSSLGLPDRQYYFKGMNDSTVSAYYNLMIESAIMLGAPKVEAHKQMLEALEFETVLAKISAPREQRRNVTRMYNKMFARDLYKLAPNIDWFRYLTALLKIDDLNLDQDEVIVKVPSFLQALDALLLRTEPRIVTNYMLWRIVRHSMSGLSKKWRELAHTYSTITTGRQAEEPRWEQCLGSLDGTLGTALSALYVKNHFNEKSKSSALEMVDYIREEFLRILNEVDWMDEETREEAKSKAKAISAYIGYPDELLNDALVEQLYSGVKMVRQNFYQNMRQLRIWSTDYAFGQLRKVNKRGDWKKHARAAVVNAYYNSLENSIEFPAGILQGAFFDADRPNYMNFGAIGYVIGHEITHGFDDRGRQFDRDGNDRNWWKPKTDARYRERAQCIIEQYGNYTVTENNLRVNGLNTQGENIADNGGIKEAFRAYRRWTKDHGREPRLPGLSDYTPDQLFWISAANIWCGKFRPEVLKLRVNSGVHSPARFRIIGPLSNSVEFSQSFACPLGSPMNPAKKCSVW